MSIHKLVKSVISNKHCLCPAKMLKFIEGKNSEDIIDMHRINSNSNLNKVKEP
jgi:hypothetical protein